MKLLYFAFILLLLTSCNSRKKEIGRIVRAWKNKEVVFPDNLETKIFGRDTCCPDLWKAKYKILHYVDTSGCSECRLQLYDWKLFKEQTDSLGLDLSFLFVAWVHNYEELETLQVINQCDIPFLYDRDGQMMELNRFPVQNNLQTFLLDSANRVVLIGNPVRNLPLRQLYFKMIREENKE